MAAVWSSDAPEVLAWWASIEERNKAYVRLCKKVEKEFDGRRIMLRTGFGDEHPMGISTLSYGENPPPGWKFGWGKRGSGFFEPRATPNKDHPKEACARAEQVIKELNAARVSVRKEAHERFGAPEFQFFGLHSISPGMVLLDNVLWLTFGDHDFEPTDPDPKDDKPHMRAWWKPRKLSEYYAACEAADLELEEG